MNTPKGIFQYATIAFISIIFTLLSCDNEKDTTMITRLETIQTLGDSDPMQALAKYKEIKPEQIEDCSRYPQIKHQQLGVRLRYKAGYKPSSPDSIITVKNYMEKHGTTEEQVEAYYYAGTVYWGLNDYPQAVENCLKAVYLIEKGMSGDKEFYGTVCNTYSLLAYLYAELRLYEEALTAAQKVYKNAKRYGLLDPIYCCHLGAAYKDLNKYSEATIYYDEAVNLIKTYKTDNKYADILASALQFYSLKKDRNKADDVFSLLTKLADEKKPYNYLISLSDYAVEFNISDLIEPTLLKVIETDSNLSSRSTALYNLIKFYYDKGDYKRCAEYAMKFRETEELSIEERAQEESLIAHGNQIYNLNRDEQIKQLKDSETQKRNLLYITIGCTLILVCGGYYSLRKNKRLLSKTALYRSQIKTVKESLAQQEHNMSTLSAQIKDTKQENDNLKEENLKIRVKVSELELKTEHYERLLSNLPSGENRKTFIEIANKFADIAQKNKTPNDEDWRLLYASINKEFPDFAPKVEHADMRHNLPITQTCYLLKIGMTNQQIMILTDTPRQTVSNRVKRIKSLIGDYL